jgi:hypothetical protein
MYKATEIKTLRGGGKRYLEKWNRIERSEIATHINGQKYIP